MRILYIVTAFPRSPGDIITPWLGETIERLRPKGIDVEVLAPSYRGLGAQVVDGTKIHRFRYAPARLETLTHDQTAPDRIRQQPLFGALVPGYVAAGSLAAARLAREGRFDVIHAFWPLPHGVLGLAARKASGVPLVSTFFGVELTWLRNQLSFLKPVARRIIQGSDAVTVISSHTEREVRRLVPDARLTTIPFGATVSVPDHLGTGERRDDEADDGTFRLLFVGRLVERKGVATLLRALAKVRATQPVSLTVVGDGPLLEALKDDARRLDVADSVNFTGFLPKDELSRRFAACDAFVLPAIRDSKGDVEGLGVVLIEAILHGKPVIASDSGGIGDIVLDGVSGLLTSPGDPGSLTAAIHRLAADATLRDTLVAGGLRIVEERFSWERITRDLEKVYMSVVENRSGVSSGSGGS